MEKRNKVLVIIYLILALLSSLRGILAISSGQSTGVIVLRFGLGVLFLIAALLYGRRK